VGQPYDSYDDTWAHIIRVQDLLEEVRGNLYNRGCEHDHSKFEYVEKIAFDILGERQRDIQYGTPEYFAQFTATPEMGPAIAHHYQANRHHPEFHAMDAEGNLNKDEVANGIAISRMTLLDLIEMLVDWRAAAERYKDGSIADSLDHNTMRFGLSSQLASILRNTVQELGL
jgi:hypothetical protein